MTFVVEIGMTSSTSLELPSEILLCVTSEQFEMLAVVNRDLKLERSSQGELIVNLPTGGETEYYSPLTQVEILDNPSTLSGEDLLLNFVLNLQKIWD
jgi:Uma2 family endonuclease